MYFFFDSAAFRILEKFFPKKGKANRGVKEAKAGIDQLDKHAWYLNTLELAGNDILKIKEVFELNLYEALFYLYIQNKKNNFEKSYNKQLMKK